MKKFLCAILCLCILLTAVPMTVFSAEPKDTTVTTTQPEETTQPKKKKKVKKVKTKVTGIKYEYNLKQSEKLKFDITVYPAKPARVVKLQRYSSEKEKYVTKKTYKTKVAKTAKLEIVIPKKYRKRTYGKWRIVVESNEKAYRYVSKPIKVYTKNLRDIDLSSKAVCIYCLDTDKVLYDKNMNKRLKPASCTKIMTLITAIESGRFNGTATVTASAVRVPAERLHARIGDRYKNKDLAFAMILGSANDASIMLANGTEGSVSNFVSKMNKTAKKIGLKDTHYTNTYGIPNSNHYTTAYELSLTTAYGYNYDQFCEVVGKREYGFRSLRYGKRYGCFTADHMVRDKVKGHIGGKTGYSEVLGASYSGLFKYKGRVYAVTIMHARSKPVRWKDVRKLYKYIRKLSRSKY